MAHKVDFHEITAPEVRQATAEGIAATAKGAAQSASQYTERLLPHVVALFFLKWLGIFNYFTSIGALSASKAVCESKVARPVVWLTQQTVAGTTAATVAAVATARMHYQSQNPEYVPSAWQITRAVAATA